MSGHSVVAAASSGKSSSGQPFPAVVRMHADVFFFRCRGCLLSGSDRQSFYYKEGFAKHVLVLSSGLRGPGHAFIGIVPPQVPLATENVCKGSSLEYM